MSNEVEIQETEPIIETVVEESVPEVNEPVVIVEEKRYTYQPKDDLGRPMGAPQVIKYTTQDELVEKLTEQNTLLTRKLRSETRKLRLGIVEPETIPDGSPRYKEPVSFKPKSLSAEEQFALARKLGIDPEDFDSVTDELFEIKFGVSPETHRQILTEIQTERINNKALSECNLFMAANPDFVKCKENSEALVAWMVKEELDPVQANYQFAYNTLRGAGVLIERIEELDVTPEPTPAVVEPTVVVLPEVVSEAAPVEFKPAHIPSGLTRDNTVDSGTAPNIGDDIVYEVIVSGAKRRYTGLSAIQAMPSDEYRRRVNSDRSFVKKEAALEKEAADRRRNRNNQ